MSTLTDFNSAVSMGFTSVNGTTVQDIDGDGQPHNTVVTGRGGVGKSILLRWEGVANAATQEARSWGIPISNLVGAKFGHPFYVTYYQRVNLPTGGGGLSYTIQIKNLELWDHGSRGVRAQFSWAYSFLTNGLPATLVDIFPDPSSIDFPATGCPMSGQCQPPYIHTYNNQYVRWTYEYMTQSAPGANDGSMRAWLDGTLVAACRLDYAGVPVPGAQGTPSGQHWTEVANLAAFNVNESVLKLTLGGVNSNNTLQAFTQEWDGIHVFYLT